MYIIYDIVDESNYVPYCILEYGIDYPSSPDIAVLPNVGEAADCSEQCQLFQCNFWSFVPDEFVTGENVCHLKLEQINRSEKSDAVSGCYLSVVGDDLFNPEVFLHGVEYRLENPECEDTLLPSRRRTSSIDRRNDPSDVKIVVQTAVDEIQCRDKCVNDGECTNWTFKLNGDCYLYAAPVQRTRRRSFNYYYTQSSQRSISGSSSSTTTNYGRYR
eukprot:Awhi_evm1s4162